VIVRLVLASLLRRSRQLALILTAVTVAAATVAALAGFSARVEGRFGQDLAAFGPNLIVRSQVGGPAGVPVAAVERVRAVPGVRSADGIGLANARLERIEVRAEPGRLAAVGQAIEARVEGVEARPLRRTSESDARVTGRLMLVLAAVSGVSLLLALLSVGAATTALMGERRTEIGLFLALGYTGRRIGGFLAAELLAAALLAGLLGELLGEIAASGLARHLLGPGGGLSVTWSGFLASAVAAVAVVGLSMLIALRRVERLDAARVLRGE
jgi:predicted lysophospholipase L1 biosynthesis ABC-type transport system permease subunit